MQVKQAKAAARRWVVEEGSKLPGFRGAYFTGSATGLPDDATYPATSDLDVHVVREDPGDALKPGKFVYRGVLLEVSYIPRDTLRSPEAVVTNGHLAGAFRTRSVIADPGVRNAAHALDEATPLHDQVTATAFAAGVTTYVLLAAGLKNLTVRKRYVAARAVLAEYGRLDFHEPLLALLGCAGMERERVEHHLGAVTAAFDAAKVAIKTPYRFGSDISDVARPISIDGSWELIERGLHREAVFWLVATYCRCRHIFDADAPELLARFDPGLHELAADLGIDSFAARQRRCRDVEAFLPQVWEVAEAIMAANPGIEDPPEGASG